MQVRNAIVAVSVAALALALGACSADPEPSATSPEPTATASTSPTAEPTESTSPEPVAGEIRPIQEGFDLANVSETLRTGFPTYAEKTDEEIAIILNAACDAMDVEPNPMAGADAIQTFGIDAYDAAFSVTASISLYCPEYSAFLAG